MSYIKPRQDMSTFESHTTFEVDQILFSIKVFYLMRPLYSYKTLLLSMPLKIM